MKRRPWFKKILKILFVYIPAGFVTFTFLWVLLLKWIPVYFTPLMIIRSIEYRNDNDFHTCKIWKNIDEISPDMVMAVMAGEDNRFLEHSGFDWNEIKKAINERRNGKRMRGASTISQQTAKNVFLYPGKSWIRKGLEVYFTCLIELIWGKERIMAVYLNVAEMGKGVYGAEAAANKLFGKSASKLTKRECALITATLPNPLKRKANSPSPYIRNRAGDIEKFMKNIQRPEWLSK